MSMARKKKGRGTIAFMWAVWNKGYSGETGLTWIPPGFRAKYEKDPKAVPCI